MLDPAKIMPVFIYAVKDIDICSEVLLVSVYVTLVVVEKVISPPSDDAARTHVPWEGTPEESFSYITEFIWLSLLTFWHCM